MISGFAVPSGIYPCKPGGANDYVFVYTSRTNPLHWRRLLEVDPSQQKTGSACLAAIDQFLPPDVSLTIPQ